VLKFPEYYKYFEKLEKSQKSRATTPSLLAMSSFAPPKTRKSNQVGRGKGRDRVTGIEG
jgi:hypothetical protein